MKGISYVTSSIMCWACPFKSDGPADPGHGHCAQRDEALAQFFKVPLNDDGFFVEKHAKLGPV
jgi:hypothetical protein